MGFRQWSVELKLKLINISRPAVAADYHNFLQSSYSTKPTKNYFNLSYVR